MKLRGAKGLGDACYVYPIASYLAKRHDRVEIMTKFPEVYEVLMVRQRNVVCIDRYAGTPDIECRYGDRYPYQDTNIWQDSLIASGLIEEGEEIPYNIEYYWPDDFGIETDKKICLIKTPCYPHGKDDGSTEILLPKLSIWQEIINQFKDRCYFVMAGLPNGVPFKFNGIDMDLSHIKTIPRLISLVDSSDITICPSGHFVSFAEGLDKKVLIGFSQRALDCTISFYRYSTPSKVITKPKTSDAFVDSEPTQAILDKFERLLNK
jgi:hypothetical protein